jgi:uncharacterized OB-fold protein
VLPEVTPRNQSFWQSGADGVLRFLRCEACATFVHPPAPVCPVCLARALAPAAVSGRGRVVTYTLCHKAWIPGEPVPYCIAIVELEDQVGLRLTTNIVGCAPETVHIGMPVSVVFEAHEDVYLPLFQPAPEPAP